MLPFYAVPCTLHPTSRPYPQSKCHVHPHPLVPLLLQFLPQGPRLFWIAAALLSTFLAVGALTMVPLLALIAIPSSGLGWLYP